MHSNLILKFGEGPKSSHTCWMNGCSMRMDLRKARWRDKEKSPALRTPLPSLCPANCRWELCCMTRASHGPVSRGIGRQKEKGSGMTTPHFKQNSDFLAGLHTRGLRKLDKMTILRLEAAKSS